MNDSKQSTEERPDYDALARRLAPKLDFDEGTMHTLGDVAAHVVEAHWTRAHWEDVSRLTDEIRALCDSPRAAVARSACRQRRQTSSMASLTAYGS